MRTSIDTLVLDFANEMLAKVKSLILSKEWSQELVENLMNQGYEYIYISSAFENVQEFVKDQGDYFLDEKGLVRAKDDANWFVRTYDGSFEEEMVEEYYNFFF